MMELVEGETLAERLQRGRCPSMRPDNCAADCRSARGRAREGIIHRDLKPANIKITPEGS